MTRALLERCRKELLSVVQSCNADIPHHDGDDFHELLRDVMTELVKPAPTQPAWHDQPTQPGLWLYAEGDREVYTWVVYEVSSLPSRLYQPDGETRWFGPIPLPEAGK